MSGPGPDAAVPPALRHAADQRTDDAVAPAPANLSSVAPQPEAASRRTAAQVAKDIALFFAGPFVTLAYLALFPFVAMKLLKQAWRDRKEAA